jgi:hypothetical protein
LKEKAAGRNTLIGTLLSMQDLQARALAEIRTQPGCSNVRKIAINRAMAGHVQRGSIRSV